MSPQYARDIPSRLIFPTRHMDKDRPLFGRELQSNPWVKAWWAGTLRRSSFFASKTKDGFNFQVQYRYITLWYTEISLRIMFENQKILWPHGKSAGWEPPGAPCINSPPSIPVTTLAQGSWSARSLSRDSPATACKRQTRCPLNEVLTQ